MIEQITAEHDAREFGLHLKQGGWRMGLLVARNVVRAPGRVSAETLAPKTNATEFARQAGTSNDRVLRYLDAWERAANAGHVPRAEALSPGRELDLDAERLPDWGHFYKTPRPSRATSLSRAVNDEATRVNDETARARAEAEDALRALAAQRQAEAAQIIADNLIDDAGRRHKDARADAGPDGPVFDPDIVSEELAAEVGDLVTKAKWFGRRLFDIARDPEWRTGRDDAAADIRTLARQLDMVAGLAADPDSGRATDEGLRELLGG